MHIEIFFAHFEKYCTRMYEEDHKAWVQVLPDYLAGEPKSLALAFGLEANYNTVKEKLVDKYQDWMMVNCKIFSMPPRNLSKVMKYSL